MGLQLWLIFPENVRQSNSLVKFREIVRNWDCIDFPCRFCKLHLPKIGFL